MLIPQTQQNLGFTEVPGWSRMMVFMIKKKWVYFVNKKIGDVSPNNKWIYPKAGIYSPGLTQNKRFTNERIQESAD